MFKGHGGNLAEIQEQYGWRPGEILDFSTNVNPLGLPPGALKVFKDSFQEISSYPDPDSRSLLRKASYQYGLPATRILAGNGSTEFIYLIPRALGFRSAVIFHPTYPDYEESARIAGCQIHSVVLNLKPLIQELHSALLDLKGRGHLVFICNPNNPTGGCYPGEELRWLIKQHPSHLFIVDEAYVDFAERENLSLLQFPMEKNMIVLRSLTKIFSIPGLRLGLAFASEEINRKLDGYKEPWTVNTPAQKTGEVLLGEKAFLEETRRYVQKERCDFVKEIRKIPGFEPIPSEVNYFLVRLTGGIKAEKLKEDLLQEKFLIRSCHPMKGLGPDFIRLAVKCRKERSLLLSALKRREA